MSTLIIYLIVSILSIAEATDDQPFVPNNEKPAEYDPNLYLYLVSMNSKHFFIVMSLEIGSRKKHPLWKSVAEYQPKNVFFANGWNLLAIIYPMNFCARDYLPECDEKKNWNRMVKLLWNNLCAKNTKIHKKLLSYAAQKWKISIKILKLGYHLVEREPIMQPLLFSLFSFRANICLCMHYPRLLIWNANSYAHNLS